MKVGLTEDGLVILMEHDDDRALLASIADDARPSAQPLADYLGGLIQDGDVAEDWREYVTPDLAEGFLTDVEFVSLAVTQVGEGREITITKDNAMQWYSALNQARLALEDRHKFTQMADVGPTDASARMRERFYLWLQSGVFSLVTDG